MTPAIRTAAALRPRRAATRHRDAHSQRNTRPLRSHDGGFDALDVAVCGIAFADYMQHLDAADAAEAVGVVVD
ncbi:hypothetical protein V492_08024 [Pseudogymnoascus sp. VKM F-4246]|nr:hypothetical protein V492_08024 [Pseudogymnoascus sp. VKM F-4246]